jgi:hypothetical protein
MSLTLSHHTVIVMVLWSMFLLGIGIALGVCWTRLRWKRSVIYGFQFLARVAQRRQVSGDDIYRAFGRSHHHPVNGPETCGP